MRITYQLNDDQFSNFNCKVNHTSYYTFARGVIAISGLAVCIDVETTGVKPGYDEIVELAVVLFSYDQNSIKDIIDSYSGLREPSCPISKSAYNVHGLSEQELKGHQLDIKRIESIIDQADFIVSHSNSFDREFTADIMPSIKDKSWYCSMKNISWVGSRSLQNLFKLHGIETEKPNRALSDVKGLLSLLSKKNIKGETYFVEMLNKEP